MVCHNLPSVLKSDRSVHSEEDLGYKPTHLKCLTYLSICVMYLGLLYWLSQPIGQGIVDLPIYMQQIRSGNCRVTPRYSIDVGDLTITTMVHANMRLQA